MPSAKKPKFYAVRKGRTKGLFLTWSECQKAVIGFPGAEFKSFPTEGEAKAWLEGAEDRLADLSEAPDDHGTFFAVRGGSQDGVFTREASAKSAYIYGQAGEQKTFSSRADAEAWVRGEDRFDTLHRLDREEGFVTAYCDGSYDQVHRLYGWGTVILPRSEEDPEEIHLCGFGRHQDYLPSRNVAGEVMGSLAAMDWTLRHGYKKIRIYHDYEGVRCWITRDWKRNTPISQMYEATYAQTYEPHLTVAFQKVSGHTGVRYNELADQLAKEGARKGVTGR